MPPRDLTGQRFGRYIALCIDRDRTTTEITYWRCRCDCGNEKSVDTGTLRGRAPNISCGCLRRELVTKRFHKHGMARTPEYHAWQALRQRCEIPNHQEFKSYGGRGITVCNRWQSFENFIADMGLRPTSKHSIERKDNDRGYEPDNCVWATFKEQSDNKQQSRRLTFEGRTQSLTRWAEEKGMKPCTLNSRLLDGWTLHDALNTPVQRRRATASTSATAL
jgi:hypothetical protein